MARERILLIRSNDSINIAIANQIEKEGYNVLLVDNIRDGLKVLSGFDPHLVIVASSSNFTEIEKLCMQTRKTTDALILVTGKHEDATKMYEIGVDTYMDEPLSVIELIAKVKSIIRRKIKQIHVN